MIRNQVVSLTSSGHDADQTGMHLFISITPNASFTNIDSVKYKLSNNNITISSDEIEQKLIQMISININKELYSGQIWDNGSTSDLSSILKAISNSLLDNSELIKNRLLLYKTITEDITGEQQIIDLLCIETCVYIIVSQLVESNSINVPIYPYAKFSSSFLSSNVMDALALYYDVWMLDLDQFIVRLGYLCTNYVKTFSFLFQSCSKDIKVSHIELLRVASELAIAKINITIYNKDFEISIVKEQLLKSNLEAARIRENFEERIAALESLVVSTCSVQEPTRIKVIYLSNDEEDSSSSSEI